MAARRKVTFTGPARSWAPAFLAAFANTGNVRAAAQVAGVDRDTVYQYRNRNEAFKAEYEKAHADAVDALAAEARRRAMSTSDTLLIYLLKVHGGEEYRNDQRRQQEHRLNPEAMKALVEKIAGMLGVDADGIQEVAERVAREAWESPVR